MILDCRSCQNPDIVHRAPIFETETYRAVRDAEETKKHILISIRRHLAHHCLSIGIIGSLKQAKEHVIDPKVAHVMISYLVGPQTQHTIEGDEDGKEIGNHEHGLGPDVEVLLHVPEAKCRADGASSLG